MTNLSFVSGRVCSYGRCSEPSRGGLPKRFPLSERSPQKLLTCVNFMPMAACSFSLIRCREWMAARARMHRASAQEHVLHELLDRVLHHRLHARGQLERTHQHLERGARAQVGDRVVAHGLSLIHI